MLHSRPQSRDMAAWNINKVRSIQLAEVNKIVGLKSFLLKNRTVKIKKRSVPLKSFLKVLRTRCGCGQLPHALECVIQRRSFHVLSHVTGFPPPWAPYGLHLWHCILISCGAPGKKFWRNGSAARGRAGNGPVS